MYGTAWDAKLIRFGQGLPWRPTANRTYGWPTHAVLVTGDDGSILEALASGLTKGNISKYADEQMAIVRPKLTPTQRAAGLAWAQAEFERHCRYGWTDIGSVVIQLLTPLKFDFNWNGSMICSAVIARYLEHGGTALPTFSPFVTTPGDLAVMGQVARP